MVPDKIYLNRRHPDPYWFKDKQLDSDVEYIRKDALYSLKSHWKPSKDQMEALLNTLHPDDPYYPELKSLYEQLQKL